MTKYGIIILAALFALATHSLAQEETWQADNARLESLDSSTLTEEQQCEAIWNVWWPWAKKGNLEARANLFFWVYPAGGHANVLFMPGPTDDLARRRNLLILAVHSTGVNFDKTSLQNNYKKLSDMYYSTLLDDGMTGTAFLKCLKSDLYGDEECARGLPETLIPSFENYAAEIDTYIAQGMKPKCVIHEGNKRRLLEKTK